MPQSFLTPYGNYDEYLKDFGTMQPMAMPQAPVPDINTEGIYNPADDSHLTRGVKSGGKFLQQVLGESMRGLGKAFNMAPLESMGTNMAEEAEFAQQHKYASDIAGVEDIRSLGTAEGWSDLGKWAAHNIGSNIDLMVPYVGAGALATKMATKSALKAAGKSGLKGQTKRDALKEFSEEQLADLAKRQSRARIGGMMGVGVPIHYGEQVGEFRESGMENPELQALAGAIPRALLDVATPEFLFRKFLHPSAAGPVKRIAGGAGVAVVTEAGTETAQEAISVGIQMLNDPSINWSDPEVQSRFINAAAAGGLVGGLFGGVAGVPGGMKRPQDEDVREDTTQIGPVEPPGGVGGILGNIDPYAGLTEPAPVSEPVGPLAPTPEQERQRVIDAHGVGIFPQVDAVARPVIPNVMPEFGNWAAPQSASEIADQLSVFLNPPVEQEPVPVAEQDLMTPQAELPLESVAVEPAAEGEVLSEKDTITAFAKDISQSIDEQENDIQAVRQLVEAKVEGGLDVFIARKALKDRGYDLSLFPSLAVTPEEEAAAVEEFKQILGGPSEPVSTVGETTSQPVQQAGVPAVSEEAAPPGLSTTESALAYTQKPEEPLYSHGRITEPTKPFYSELTRQVEALKQPRAPATHWKSAIKKLSQKGVKAEEIKWSGVEEWMDEQKGAVTKEQLVDYLRSQEVVVEEVVKGEQEVVWEQRDNYYMPSIVELGYIEYMPSNRMYRYEGYGGVTKAYKTLEEAKSDAERTLNNVRGLGDTTKFSDYQMEGEKEGYRELVMTLPAGERTARYEELRTQADKLRGMKLGEEIAPGVTVQARLGEIESLMDQVQNSPQYVSPHFEEPNVVAHIRFNERMIDGKRTMFIEEVQSDWAQEGRKEGYKGQVEVDEERIRPLTEKEVSFFGTEKFPEAVKFQLAEGTWSWMPSRERAIEAMKVEQASATAVPNQPFKKTGSWAMLGVKRAIRWAAENGFEQVAWTPGEVQVKRYEEALRKIVDRVEWTKTDKGIQLRGFKQGIKVTDTTEKESTLSGAVGKSMGSQIIDSPKQTGVIEGDNITIDDTGMLEFYDEILKNSIGKFVKKFGAKVGVSEVDAGGFKVNRDHAELPYRLETTDSPDILERFSTAEEAWAKAEELGAQKVWSFPITESMRESAMAGLPLFSSFSRTVTNLNTNLDAALMEEQIQKIDEITATVRQMLGATLAEQITLKTPDYMVGEKGMPAAGSFDPITAVMRVALNAVEPVSVAAHEGFHAAQHYLMTRSERAITQNAFKPGKPLRAKLESQMELAGDRAAVQQMDSPMEAEAYGYQYWLAGKLRTNGPVETIFRKIAQFFERVKNLLQGNGFQSWEDVFDALYLGQLANRNVKLGPQYKYNALHVSAVEKEQGRSPGSKLFSHSDTQDDAEADSIAMNGQLADGFAEDMGKPGLRHYGMNREEIRDKLHKAWVQTVGSMKSIAQASPLGQRVFDLIQSMLGTKAAIISDMDVKLTDFINEPAEVQRKLARVMLRGGTLEDKRYAVAVDKGVITGDPYDLQILRTKYHLSDREIGVYIKVRKALDNLVDTWTKARISAAKKAGDSLLKRSLKDKTDEQRIEIEKEITEQIKKQIAEYNKTADWMKATGYVPLRRYGKLVLAVYDKTKGRKKGLIYYAHFESEAKRKQAAEQVKGVLKNVRSRFAVEMAEESDVNIEFNTKKGNIGVETSSSQFKEFMDRLDELEIDIDDATRKKFMNYILNSEQAMLRDKIPRGAYPGYEKDIIRVLADYTVTTANATAALEYTSDINRIMANGEAWLEEGSLGGFHHEQMADLVQFMRSGDIFNDTSEEVVGKLRGFAALSMLGGNISAGIINLTQIPFATIPYMVKYMGVARTYSAVLGALRDTGDPTKFGSLKLSNNEHLKAAAEANGGKGRPYGGLTADETKIMWLAVERGEVQAQQIFAMAGLAQGRLLARSNKVRRAAEMWMTPFVLGEETNRRTTFLVAYRVGRQMLQDGQKLTDQANRPFLDPVSGQEITDKNTLLYEFAKRAVDDTQYVYNRGNRPAWARKGLGEALFTFKTFPIFMYEQLRYMQKSGNTKGATTMLATIMLASGTSGLFFMDDLSDLLDTLGQKLGIGSPNIRRAASKLIQDMADDMDAAWLGDVVINGLLDTAFKEAPFLPDMSISGRLSMGNILPGTGVALEGEELWSGTMKDIGGPIGSVLEGSQKFIGEAVKGDVHGMARNFPATGIKNFYKAVFDYEGDIARDSRGYKVAEISPAARWMKAIGFTPYAVTREYDKMKLAKKTTSFMATVKRDIMTDLVRALDSGDKTAYNEIMQSVVEWNRVHPDPQWFIKLRKEDVRKAYKKSQQTVTERMYETTPKDQRAGYRFLLH